MVDPAPTRGRRTTLATVADAAGVSLPTVSKVLNGRADVAAGTRARVERVLQEHDYRRSSSRRPATQARTVGLVFDDLLSPYAAEIIRGVTDAGSDLGVDVVVGRFADGAARGRSTEGDSWPRRLARAGREGVIVVTSDLTTAQVTGFERAHVPLVVIDPVGLPRKEIASVGATNWSGGLSATEHLTELGHRRIGFIGGPLRAPCNQARLHGYRAALENAGFDADDSLVVFGTFHYPEAYELGLAMLDRPDRPTAVFAASDVTALGVMEAARHVGLRIPDDLSVVGFDDTYVAAWSTPPLTTVGAPLRDVGRVALRTLLRLVAGEALESHHVELATHLVVRSSTAPPGGGSNSSAIDSGGDA